MAVSCLAAIAAAVAANIGPTAAAIDCLPRAATIIVDLLLLQPSHMPRGIGSSHHRHEHTPNTKTDIQNRVG